MKKNTIKAFTLVEMLIVIVIIGILIAALMPRMQSAQWRARDVSRKNALSQIQTAIITSQQDKWVWPGMSSNEARAGIPVSQISWSLITAWMSSIPTDPLESTEVSWLANAIATWDYLYMVTYRNWTEDWWFVLMAKTEVEWWSNWIVCGTQTWNFTQGQDLRDWQSCTTFTKDDAATQCTISNWSCTYQNDWQLRYVLVY